LLGKYHCAFKQGILFTSRRNRKEHSVDSQKVGGCHKHPLQHPNLDFPIHCAAIRLIKNDEIAPDNAECGSGEIKQFEAGVLYVDSTL